MSDYDLLVVGAGPAGMSAAIEAAKYGLSTAVVDEQMEPGGQIYKGVWHLGADRARRKGRDFAHGYDLIESFRQCGASYWPGNHVWGLQVDGTAELSDGERSRPVTWRFAVVATGAIERPVPLQNWTLPGVMTVGAAQIALKSGAYIPPGRVWVVGSGPLAYLFAHQIREAGGQLAGFIDTTPASRYLRALSKLPSALKGWRYLVAGASYLRSILLSGTFARCAFRDVEIIGDRRVKAIRFLKNGQWREEPAEWVLLHDGVVPNTRLSNALGLKTGWNEQSRYFVPETGKCGQTSAPNIYVAGDGAGIRGAHAAEFSGRRAAVAIAAATGRLSVAARDNRVKRLRSEESAHLAIRPFLDDLYAPSEVAPPDGVVVCRCEGVTAGRIRAASKSGAMGINQLKAFTRCGMGPCQGRLCELSANEIVAAERNVDPMTVGQFRVRAPYKPITIAELVDGVSVTHNVN